MKIIGLCGQSGAGKGTVSSVFAKREIPVIDSDRVYREITEPGSECLLALKEEFGQGIINGQGGLDRKQLSAAVFNDGKKRQRLNGITFAYIKKEIEKKLDILKESGKKFVLLDAPLLFESGADRMCDITIAVTADRKTKLARITRRDLLTEELAALRLDSQISDEELIKKCTYSIENNGTINELEVKTEKLINMIAGS